MARVEQERRAVADERDQRTSRRTAANRKNAGRSTGPKTERGKAIASRNSTTHGLLSSCIVVDWSGFEDPENFQTLRRDLATDLQPEGALEELYVEKIAVGLWRLQRMWGFERGRIVRALRDEVLQELVERRIATEKEYDLRCWRLSERVEDSRRDMETLQATLDALGSYGAPGVDLETAITAAITELDRASSRVEQSATAASVESGDGHRENSVGGTRPQRRPYAGWLNRLASILQAERKGKGDDEKWSLEYDAVHDEIEVLLELYKMAHDPLVDLLEAFKRYKESTLANEEKREDALLRERLGPPPEGLDVYMRYESSVERRLQKDIETLYALQAIRRGSPPRKLLTPGARRS